MFTIHSNLPLIFQVAFVSRDNDGEGILVLDAENLLVKCGDFLERIARGDRVHQEEALSGAHVLLPHGTNHASSVRRLDHIQKNKNTPIFLLSGRVEDIKQRYFLIDDTLLAVRVLDSLRSI